MMMSRGLDVELQSRTMMSSCRPDTELCLGSVEMRRPSTELDLGCKKMERSYVDLNLGYVASERPIVKLCSNVKSKVELCLGCLNNFVWYLDMEASNHMRRDWSFFKELIKVEAKFVSFGDDSKVIVKGRGTIRNLEKDGRVGEVKDVYYVPELKSNILSMG